MATFISPHASAIAQAGILASLKSINTHLRGLKGIYDARIVSTGDTNAVLTDMLTNCEGMELALAKVNAHATPHAVSQDLSLLRPHAVEGFNMARNIMAIVVKQGAQGRQVALQLLTVRHTCCAVMTAASKGRSPLGLLEASRCWNRTGAAWASFPGHEVQAHIAYAAALAALEAAGGVHTVSTHLSGPALEAQMQVVLDSMMMKADFEWNALTQTTDPAFTVVKVMLAVPPSFSVISKASPSVGDAATAVRALEESVYHLLAHDCTALLPHLPHMRMTLGRKLSEHARYFLLAFRHAQASPWLLAALQTLGVQHTDKPSDKETDIAVGEAEQLSTFLLLSLASCELELMVKQQSGNAELECTSQASASRVMGYISAARADNSAPGRHLMLKLACMHGDEARAVQHLTSLMGLVCADLANASIGTVPLGHAGEGEGLEVHALFPIVASACRAYAAMKGYDAEAFRAYLDATARFRGMKLEQMLLLHDVLNGVVVAIRPEGLSEDGSIVSHHILADARVNQVLSKLIKMHASGASPMPAHVRSTVVALLEGGIASAFEAREWTQAEAAASCILQVQQGDTQGAAYEGDAADLARTHQVLAQCHMHSGDMLRALLHARTAMGHHDTSVTRFLVFRILAAMHIPAGAQHGGADAEPSVDSITKIAREALESGTGESVGLDMSTDERADLSTPGGYAFSLCTAFTRLLLAPDFKTGTLVLGVSTLVHGMTHPGNAMLRFDMEVDASGSSSDVGQQIDASAAARNAPKLALAAFALERLLLSSKDAAWDLTSVHPHLRTSPLVKQLINIRALLHANEEEGAPARPVKQSAKDEGKSEPSSAALHCRTDLRLLSTCLERIAACRRIQGQGVTEDIVRTCGGEEDLAWCLNSAWNACLTAHMHGDTLGCLAAASAVNAFAITLLDLPREPNARAESHGELPLNVREGLRARNLLYITRIMHLLQAFGHLLLAESCTPLSEGSAGRAQRYVHDRVAQALGTGGCGPDLANSLPMLSEAAHLNASMAALAACRRVGTDVAQQEGRVRHAAASAGMPLASIDSLLDVSQPTGQTTALKACSLSETARAAACSASVVVRAYAYGAGASSATAGEQEDGSGGALEPAPAECMQDDTALAATLLVLEFNAQARTMAIQNAAAMDEPDAGAGAMRRSTAGGLTKSASEHLSMQVTKLQSALGMTPRLLEHASQIAAGAPCNDAQLALRALESALGLALKPMTQAQAVHKPAPGRTATVDYQYVALLLRRMIGLSQSRKDTLPTLRTAAIIVIQCLQEAMASSARTHGHATARLFPVEDLDALAVTAWNHGVFFFRMHALEAAAVFMGWALRAVPLLVQLDMLERGHTMTATHVHRLCADAAAVSSVSHATTGAIAEVEDNPAACLAQVLVVEGVLSTGHGEVGGQGFGEGIVPVVCQATVALEITRMRAQYEQTVSLLNAQRNTGLVGFSTFVQPLPMTPALAPVLVQMPPARTTAQAQEKVEAGAGTPHAIRASRLDTSRLPRGKAARSPTLEAAMDADGAAGKMARANVHSSVPPPGQGGEDEGDQSRAHVRSGMFGAAHEVDAVPLSDAIMTGVGTANAAVHIDTHTVTMLDMLTSSPIDADEVL